MPKNTDSNKRSERHKRQALGRQAGRLFQKLSVSESELTQAIKAVLQGIIPIYYHEINLVKKLTKKEKDSLVKFQQETQKTQEIPNSVNLEKALVKIAINHKKRLAILKTIENVQKNPTISGLGQILSDLFGSKGKKAWDCLPEKMQQKMLLLIKNQGKPNSDVNRV